MVDISKCLNIKCPKRSTCYRYLVIGNQHRQSFADFKPDSNGNCSYHWNVAGWPKNNLMSVADADAVVLRIKS